MLLHLCSSGSGSTGGSSRKEKRDKMLIYIRLFLGMGITWYFEILNFALSSLEPDPRWLIFTDTLIMCQVTLMPRCSIQPIFRCREFGFSSSLSARGMSGD